MTEKSYNIKAVTVGDEHALSQLAEGERLIFSDPWSPASLASSIADPACFVAVAEHDGHVAGYIIASFVADESELLRIAVMPHLRRCGVARALMERYVKECTSRGAVQCFLEVRCSNTAAVSLYEKYGFKEYARRGAYYRAPLEDASLMSRTAE